MPAHFTEKRNFIRMETDSKIEYRKSGSKQLYCGQCINLSASGVLFSSSHHVSPGTEVEINIAPELTIVRPLQATIQVVRSQIGSDGGYTIAGAIKNIAP